MATVGRDTMATGSPESDILGSPPRPMLHDDHRSRRGCHVAIALTAASTGAFLACGGRALDEQRPASPDAASSLVDATAPSDASHAVPPNESGTPAPIAEAGTASGAGPDAPPPSDPCGGSGDVYSLDVEGPQGPLQLGVQRYTNVGVTWYVYAQPGELNLMFESGAGPAGSLQVWGPGNALPAPGTYPQGPSNTGPSLEIADYSEGCNISSGTMTISELASAWPDGGTVSGNVSSLRMSFDVVCGGDTIRGCVRYVGDGPYPHDAGSSGVVTGVPFDAGSSADLLPLCADAGYAIYVAGSGNAAVQGLVGTTGASGTWRAGLTSGSMLDLQAETPLEWGITASSDFVNGSYLAAGNTYTSSPSSSLSIHSDRGGGRARLSLDHERAARQLPARGAHGHGERRSERSTSCSSRST